MIHLSPLQSGEDARRNWRRINELTSELQRSQAKVEVLERKVADLCRLKFSVDGARLSLSRYKVVSVEGDYLLCHTWDGTTEGETPVNIAKPFKLRASITSETIEGVAVSYSYASGSQRTASASGYSSEEQKIIPPYLEDDIIYGISCDTEVSVSGSALPEMDCNMDGRAWARIN